MNQSRSIDREMNKRGVPSDDPRWGQSAYDGFVVGKPTEDIDGKWWIYIRPSGSEIIAIEDIDPETELLTYEEPKQIGYER